MFMNSDDLAGSGPIDSNQWIKTISSSTQSSLYHSNLNLIDSVASGDPFALDENSRNVHRNTTSKTHGSLCNMMTKPSQTAAITAAITSDASDSSATSMQFNKNKSRSWVVRDCPPSLKFFVQFYRWFGFSFTGIVFVDEKDELSLHKNHSSRKIFNSNNVIKNNSYHNNNGQHWFVDGSLDGHQSAKKSDLDKNVVPLHYGKREEGFWLRMQRYFYLYYNIVMFIWFLQILATMIIDKYLDNSAMMEVNESNGTILNETIQSPFMSRPITNETLSDEKTKWTASFQSGLIDFINKWSEFFRPILNLNKSQTDINQLKPILRAIIDSLLYVVLFDNLVSIFYLMMRGGRLIELLMQIPNIEVFDYSKRFAYQALGTMLGLSCIINTLGFISFNNDALQDLLNSSKAFWEKAVIIGHLWIYIIMFFYLSVVPILFIYTMMLFKFTIEKLLNAFAAVNLDEIHMLKLKTKLSNLNDQFKEIIPYFALPLTVNFASNIFIIISSACFLMINSTRTVNQYMSFVFSLGLFAFLRLIVVACMGNLPTNICRDLIRTVYENLEQWSLNEWMCFMELKRLRKEFTVSIFSMYTVRQSSILAMLGFALNYIVILLQTENYSSNSPADNATLSMNDTINATLFNESAIDENNMKTQSLFTGRQDQTRQIQLFNGPNPFLQWLD